MPDSMDPITALYRRFGGDPARVFGQSPEEKQAVLTLRDPDRIEQRLNHRYGNLAKRHDLQPLNPFLHGELITLAQEVATALNVPSPRLYRMVNPKETGVLVAGCRYPNIVVLDTDILGQLEPEERQAVLYHELHHARQPWGRILRNQQTGESLLAHSWLHRPAMRLLEQCIAYRQSMEHEASAVAAHFTSPDVMQRALLKGLALALTRNHPDWQIDLNQSASGIAASLDACLGTEPGVRLAEGGTMAQHAAFLDSLICEDRTARTCFNHSRY